MTEDELVGMLIFHRIPFVHWGKGSAKRVEDLLAEANAGEIKLDVSDGKLKRTVRSIGAILYHQDGDRQLVLHEEKQVFDDGRSRRRTLETSLGEKILPNESVYDALARALKEELGFVDELKVEPGATILKTEESKSYPGLLTAYEILTSRVEIPDHLFKPEGYVVRDGDKTVYFVWR